MAQATYRVAGLPDGPIDAARHFYASEVTAARAALEGGDALVLVFAPADHSHRAWRLAAVQDLAREAAPKRVNGIAGADETAIASALAYLEGARGVTGQLLAVDGKSAETR